MNPFAFTFPKPRSSLRRGLSGIGQIPLRPRLQFTGYSEPAERAMTGMNSSLQLHDAQRGEGGRC
jgi:hypothetical protein